MESDNIPKIWLHFFSPWEVEARPLPRYAWYKDHTLESVQSSTPYMPGNTSATTLMVEFVLGWSLFLPSGPLPRRIRQVQIYDTLYRYTLYTTVLSLGNLGRCPELRAGSIAAECEGCYWSGRLLVESWCFFVEPITDFRLLRLECHFYFLFSFLIFLVPIHVWYHVAAIHYWIHQATGES